MKLNCATHDLECAEYEEISPANGGGASEAMTDHDVEHRDGNNNVYGEKALCQGL